MNKGLRIFMAVAIGIFSGLTIMTQTTIWWRLLGTISAGLLAYFGFAPLVFLRAVPKAATLASQWLVNGVIRLWSNRRSIALCGLLGLMCIIWVAIVMLVFFAPLLVSDSSTNFMMGVFVVSCFSVMFGILITGIIMQYHSVAKIPMMVAKYNPVVVLGFIVPLFLVKGAYKLTVFSLRFLFWTMPKFLFWTEPRFLGRFLWHLFILVHCQERLICMIDAMIGVIVFSHILDINQLTARLIGALVGGLFGVFNYEVIAKRWLHLPQRREQLLA